ncbi:MAG: extracellular solute-binding protein [Oscillospiraceae bacterium]|nr:extracellular solute-binding protein [Oscillospiraceae bacterium]
MKLQKTIKSRSRRAAILWLPVVTVLLASCGTKTESPIPTTQLTETEPEQTLSIRIAQPDREQRLVWADLGADYQTLTGIPVETAVRESGASFSEPNTPTVILFRDIREIPNLAETAYNLAETAVFNALADSSTALRVGGKAAAVPLDCDVYGLLVNKNALLAYTALSNRVASINAAEDIKSFADLKELVQELTKHKSELQIKGAFAAPSLKADGKTWLTHALSLPISAEFRSDNVSVTGGATTSITFRNGGAYLNLLSLAAENGTAKAEALQTRTDTAAIQDFAYGNAVFLPGTTADWPALDAVKDRTVTNDSIAFIPLYMGLPEETDGGVAVEGKLWAAISATATEAEQKAAVDFLSWLTSSERGTDFLLRSLQLWPPYTTLPQASLQTNPITTASYAFLTDGTHSNRLSFVALLPEGSFPAAAGKAFAAYTTGKTTEDTARQAIVIAWKAAYLPETTDTAG